MNFNAISTPSFAFGASPQITTAPTSTASVTALSSPANLTSTTVTTQSSGNSTQGPNFFQLEELINKWNSELEEQEKKFINQATQVNSWSKVLIDNSNNILKLDETVAKVKIEQQTLEKELEFIAAQHADLDECIKPLEDELTKIPHIDIKKAQTFFLAESLDTQLKRMSEDLKEVMEHINEANKVQDPNDPVVQIGRILNAHMSSLQWIESSTSLINGKLYDLSNVYENLRKDTEKSIRLTYD